MDQLKNFAKMFEDIDQLKDKLGIQSYGVSITTMEEVFLRVNQLGEEAVESKIQRKESFKQQSQIYNSQIKADDFNLQQDKIKSSCTLFLLHFKALFIKRLIYFKRDLRGIFCEILLPCFLGTYPPSTSTTILFLARFPSSHHGRPPSAP